MTDRPLPVLLAAAILLLALPALAQEEPPVLPQAGGEARFFVETIAVEGLRHASERVIVAETRLQASREYTEAEIRAGAARAARLPFVVRIDPRIEKGSRRGAYRLVLAVTETKPVFFGALYRVLPDQQNDHRLTAGGRAFLGRGGVLHVAGGGGNESPAFEVGYTQYDLFGRGVFASATATYGRIVGTPRQFYTADAADHVTLRALAGVPLRGNHALRATFTSAPLPVRAVVPQDVPVWLHRSHDVERSSTLELGWIYDSTDDPLLTTQGTRAAVTAAVRQVPFTAQIDDTHLGPLGRGIDRQPWLTADVQRVWSVAPRHSVAVRVADSYIRRQLGFTGRSDVLNQAVAGGGYYYTVWGPERPSRLGDLRLEADFIYEHAQRTLPFVRFDEHRSTMGVGLLFRNEWGVLRLRFDVERGPE